MKVLLLAGAGTSMELGVPGMVGMAKEFLAHSRQWEIEPELVQKIMGSSLDVEHLIEGLDSVCMARPSLEAIGQASSSYDRIDKVRAEVEWFVQHTAERVVARDAQLMWGSVLRASRSNDIALVTTNYDRAIELAANAEGIDLDDGFAPFAQGETAPWTGFGEDATYPLLVKLHGSTDWYAEGEAGAPTKLRHPMPLFGRAALRLANGQQLGSALVLPSREKLLTRAPYPRLSQAFLNAGDWCDLAVFVGSSLRDHHIREAARSVARRAPVFIVNPEDDNYGLEDATTIAQRASTFLVATLPNALASPNPTAALLSAAARPDTGSGDGLAAVRDALDTNGLTRQRCAAIEDLDDREATLDAFLLGQLLEDDDPTVARHALALIPLSPACDALTTAAERSPHIDEPAFREDLDLLRKLVFQAPPDDATTADQSETPAG